MASMTPQTRRLPGSSIADSTRGIATLGALSQMSMYIAAISASMLTRRDKTEMVAELRAIFREEIAAVRTDHTRNPDEDPEGRGIHCPPQHIKLRIWTTTPMPYREGADGKGTVQTTTSLGDTTTVSGTTEPLCDRPTLYIEPGSLVWELYPRRRNICTRYRVDVAPEGSGRPYTRPLFTDFPTPTDVPHPHTCRGGAPPRRGDGEQSGIRPGPADILVQQCSGA
ncbi:Hypothetical predicted protein [Pelobates cultripes]|uniref:Uncharacterized protein n=1 Tax=Pelobates cultripes TaxID=61616 RepID=A0AAD1VLD9_PELCU|nr:Hypothetical predicted protein [Pelobates cultripes]